MTHGGTYHNTATTGKTQEINYKSQFFYICEIPVSNQQILFCTHLTCITLTLAEVANTYLRSLGGCYQPHPSTPSALDSLAAAATEWPAPRSLSIRPHQTHSGLLIYVPEINININLSLILLFISTVMNNIIIIPWWGIIWIRCGKLHCLFSPSSSSRDAQLWDSDKLPGRHYVAISLAHSIDYSRSRCSVASDLDVDACSLWIPCYQV